MIDSSGVLEGQLEVQFDNGKFNDKIFLYHEASDECKRIEAHEVGEDIYNHIVDVANKNYKMKEVK